MTCMRGCAAKVRSTFGSIFSAAADKNSVVGAASAGTRAPACGTASHDPSAAPRPVNTSAFRQKLLMITELILGGKKGAEIIGKKDSHLVCERSQ
ncbi:MAG TPA: hypothetical protein PLA87_10600, partial [Pseudomonadota bacterium]|nr:hypothetical protein [Pseudomonadota bacterium]